MKILALDPSAGTTGWAFFCGKCICEADFKSFDKTEFNGDRYLQAQTWLEEMIKLWKPDLILIEGYFFSSRFATGTSVNSELRGSMKATIRDFDLPYTVVNPTAWKRTITGRVRPTRAEKKKWGKEKSKKMMVLIKLKEMGIKFPEKVKNPKTGKMINFKFDVSDALGILIAHLQDFEIEYIIHSELFVGE
jgi:Holliday junction resolvasome RuvABC endonuclease subunit